jgi:hypothetical protein
MAQRVKVLKEERENQRQEFVKTQKDRQFEANAD